MRMYLTSKLARNRSTIDSADRVAYRMSPINPAALLSVALTIVRSFVCVASALSIGPVFAQANLQPVPAGWPNLRLNSEEPPSCVFGDTLLGPNTPAYFCAVILKDLAVDPTVPPGNHGSGGWVAGIFVNPATGAITETPPLMTLAQPKAVACVLLSSSASSVDCLIVGATMQADVSLGRFSNTGTPVLYTPMAPSMSPAIQSPPATIGALASNISCVPWQSGTTSCFIIDGYGQIRQWTNQNSAWSTPQDQSSAGFKSPMLPVYNSANVGNPATPALSLDRQALSCSSSTTGTVDCFVRATVAGGFSSVGDLVRLRAVGSTFSPKEGLSWTTMTPVDAPTGLATAPECLSAVMGRSDCFFGFSGRTGLGSAGDDGSRPVGPLVFTSAIANLGQDLSNVSIRPSCVSFSANPGPGAYECAFDYNPGVDPSDIPTGNFADANIDLALSNGPFFWTQSLGVAAPSEEWGTTTVLGHSLLTIVTIPKAVKSLTCARGPNYQSLCVAAVVESHPGGPPPANTPQWKTFEAKAYRLVWTLAGTIGVAPAPPPPARLPPLP